VNRRARVVAETPDALAFFPVRPVCLGHTIVIPKAHVRDLWAADGLMTVQLMQVVINVGHAIRAALQPESLNLISSAGEAASQTVFHLHLHVVACAENLIRPGGSWRRREWRCSGSGGTGLVSSPRFCQLRHDDRLCCCDWSI
jgi:histidine triad (HIT) family protein